MAVDALKYGVAAKEKNIQKMAGTQSQARL